MTEHLRPVLGPDPEALDAYRALAALGCCCHLAFFRNTDNRLVVSHETWCPIISGRVMGNTPTEIQIAVADLRAADNVARILTPQRRADLERRAREAKR